MARKHEKFSYNYGWRTAPEQWNFYWNNKLIQLDHNTRSEVALLMLSGKETEAEAILKRLLRKQEKGKKSAKSGKNSTKSSGSAVDVIFSKGYNIYVLLQIECVL